MLYKCNHRPSLQHKMLNVRANCTGAPHNPVAGHLNKPMVAGKTTLIAVTIIQPHKSICRSCVTRPKGRFTRKIKVTRQSFHSPFPLKKSVLLRSTVYLTTEAYKSQKKTRRSKISRNHRCDAPQHLPEEIS